MVSMGVSYVVPRMTLMASFCTLSSLSKFDCDSPGSKGIQVTQNNVQTKFKSICIWFEFNALAPKTENVQLQIPWAYTGL